LAVAYAKQWHAMITQSLLAMPASFDHLGVRFQYPESWALETSEDGEGNDVTVYNPEGAFWSLTIHDQGEPESLAKEAVAAMQAEYDELDCEQVTDSIAGQRLTAYDLNFYCLDLTNTAHIRAFRRDDRTFLLMWQAEDREFDFIAPIFRAITTSLIEGTGQ
jgi:hypothetical protein